MGHRALGRGNHHANTVHMMGYEQERGVVRAPITYKVRRSSTRPIIQQKLPPPPPRRRINPPHAPTHQMHDPNTPTVPWSLITSRDRLSRHLKLRFEANLHDAVNEGGRLGANASYFLGAEVKTSSSSRLGRYLTRGSANPT